jgi:hypothetical protein
MTMPRARWSDPGTSHAAAKGLSLKRLGHIHRAILDVIVGARDGATWHEVSTVLEPRRIARQTISPRWRFLVKHGLIETRTQVEAGAINGVPTLIPKIITRPGEFGRQQTVWFATQAGLNVARLIRLNQGGTTEVVE